MDSVLGSGAIMVKMDNNVTMCGALSIIDELEGLNMGIGMVVAGSTARFIAPLSFRSLDRGCMIYSVFRSPGA